jgi:hypothetical protein
MPGPAADHRRERPRKTGRRAPALGHALAGNRDVEVRVLDGISHSFLPDPVGLSSG